MRRTRTGAGLLVAALAAAATAVMASGAQAGGGGERVRLLDDCERVSFDAALFPGACVGDGDTTFAEFLEEFEEEGEVGAWKFNPSDTHIDHGEHLRAVNRGGEAHTFTEVAQFGGGCVPELNAGAAPVPECATSFGPTLVLPGQTLRVPAAQLTPGDEHLFMCLIHPWMRTVVDVRADD